MESLKDNKALLYSLLLSGVAIIALTTGIVPEVSQQFEIIEFDPEVSRKVFVFFCNLLFHMYFHYGGMVGL